MTFWAWVEVMIGIFILIVAYLFGVPLDNMIAQKMIELGSPAAPTIFLQQMIVWVFVGMGVLLILYGFVSGYRKTTDTGVFDEYNL